MSDDEVTFNIDGLDKLLSALKGKPPTASIGVPGTPRTKDGNGKGPELTNAQVGAFHEFGTSKLPVRSFLRVPLIDHLAKRLESKGLLDQHLLQQVIATRSPIPWAEAVVKTAAEIVDEAFETSGFGKWPPSDMRHKQNPQTLIETSQLRESIVTEVKR